MSVVCPPCICICLTSNVRMSRQMRTRSNRLRWRNDNDRRRFEVYRIRLIAHASKMLRGNWAGSIRGNGIPIKKQRGGQRLKSLRHRHRSQLHGRPIPEIRVRNLKLHRPHRLRDYVGTGADGDIGVEEAAEEGEATKPRRIVLATATLPSLRKRRRESD